MRSKLLPALLLLAVIAGLYACSRIETQKSLARRFSEADGGFVTNHANGWSMPLTTEDLRKVIHAVSTAKKQRGHFDCSPATGYRFFKNTNFLGGFDSCGKLFWVERGPHRGGWRRVVPYFDMTGTLEKMETGLREREIQRIEQSIQSNR